MAGTNAYAAKRKLVDFLAASPSLTIPVLYAYGDQPETEDMVYAGKVTFEQDYAAMTSGRKPRDETVTVDLHVEVRRSPGSFDDTDSIAVQYGTVVEELIADNITFSGQVGGLRWAGITGGEMQNAMDDAGRATLITYHVTFRSRLF